MRTRFIPATALSVALLASQISGSAQVKGVSWLDEPTPESWNTPGAPMPDAPKVQGSVDARCREAARPPQLDEDKRVRERGWDLVGAYQGGWQILVIRATAGYDGMCRPRQYQDLVFVRGAFAGTLSPQPMDSRSDGALGQVFLQNAKQLSAEYARYGREDALCCPSGTTRVVFDVAQDPPLLRPVSASTSKGSGQTPSLAPSSSGPAGTSWQLVEFQGSDDRTLTPDDRAKYTIEFAAGGQLIARIDCNRGRGTWKSSGSNQIAFGPMALTRAQCPPGSLHDQIVTPPSVTSASRLVRTRRFRRPPPR
jgi:heat shock protein HslJ